MRSLQGALRKQYAVVGQDSDGIAADVGKTADQGRTVELFELIQLGRIDEARNHLANVVWLTQVRGNNTVQFSRIVFGLARSRWRIRILGRCQARNDSPRNRQGMCIVFGIVVADA